MPPAMSAFGGKADLNHSLAKGPLLAISGHSSLGEVLKLSGPHMGLAFLISQPVMRWRQRTRGALIDSSGRNADRLLSIATAGGADALGIPAGRIAPGHLADFVTIDLDTPALRDTDPENLSAALVFGAGDEAIADVCIGGRWISP